VVEEASEHTVIHAPPGHCLEVALDVERYPEWARDIKAAAVLDRDELGRCRRAAFRAAAMGHSARYVLRYAYDESPTRMCWELEEGDIVRRLDGEYVFEPAGGNGTASTSVRYHLMVELAVPLPGFVKRRAESKIVHTALDELKRRCEGRAPA
jgi:hypothetical protein